MKESIAEFSFQLYELLYPILGFSFLAVFFLIIPLGLFDKTRGFSSTTLMILSYVFGAGIWLYSAGIAFSLLGWFWLILGILLAGLGVVVVAFFGALSHGYFSLAFGILIYSIFVYGLRFVSHYLHDKIVQKSTVDRYHY